MNWLWSKIPALPALMACLVLAGGNGSLSAQPCESAAQSSGAGPGNGALVGVGALLAVPDYFLWVTLHEGSHAVAAKAMGAESVRMKIIPEYSNGHLFLGVTRWKGGLTPGQTSLVLIAPKITDLLALGSYTAMLESGSMPKDRWANLGVMLFATGAWVDFSKHLFQNYRGNDMVEVYENWGAHTDRQKLPFRLLHGTLAVGAGIEVGRGWYQLFKGARPEKAAPAPLTRYGSPIVTPQGIGWAGRF